jgi:hypothetical protein
MYVTDRPKLVSRGNGLGGEDLRNESSLLPLRIMELYILHARDLLLTLNTP